MRLTPARLQPVWTDFQPNVYTAMATTPAQVARTIQYARYTTNGRIVEAVASVTVSATTSGGVGIDLPVPAVQRFFDIGNLVLMGAGTLPSDQSGVAYMAAGPPHTRLVLVGYSQGFRDVSQSGQVLRYSVRYEAAA